MSVLGTNENDASGFKSLYGIIDTMNGFARNGYKYFVVCMIVNITVFVFTINMQEQKARIGVDVITGMVQSRFC